MVSHAFQRQVFLCRIGFGLLLGSLAMMSLVFYESPQKQIGITVCAVALCSVIGFFSSLPLVKWILEREVRKNIAAIQGSQRKTSPTDSHIFNNTIYFQRNFLLKLFLNATFVIVVTWIKGWAWPIVLIALTLTVLVVAWPPPKLRLERGFLIKSDRRGTEIDRVDLRETRAVREYFYGGLVLIDSEGKITFGLPLGVYDLKPLEVFLKDSLIKIR